MFVGRIARRALLVALCAAGVAGCGPRATGAPANGPDADDVALKLQRAWLLVEFTPNDPLDPALSGFLAGQLGNLVIDVGQSTFTASGPDVEVTRNYELVRSLFDRAEVALFGDDGTTYSVHVELIGDGLHFVSKTPPWRGSGQLAPVAGAQVSATGEP